MPIRARLPHLAALLSLGLLAACGERDALADRELEPLGNFYLGHNIVTVEKPVKSPVSRSASNAEWKRVMTEAIERRLGGYDGTRYYHTGISVDGYALAPPGIPLVLAPKSVLIVSASVWDDASQEKLNDEPERIVVFEDFSAETVVGSGLTKTKEEQMEALADNAAAAVHRWLLENREWFESDEPAGPAAESPAVTPAEGPAAPA